MSMDPAMIQQLLASKLQQPGTAGGGPGGQGGQQMTGAMSPLNAGAQLMQKVMLMKALQSQSPAGQAQRANAAMPQTTAAIAGQQPQQQQQLLDNANTTLAQNPQIQALQQPPGLPQVPPVDPSLLPIAGYS